MGERESKELRKEKEKEVCGALVRWRSGSSKER
jgi:hypothetical protein